MQSLPTWISLESLSNTRFFYKQHFYNQRQAEIGKKIKQMLSNTLRWNFCYLRIIYILHPRYHPNIIRYILKNKQRNMCICIHELIRLIIMKINMKMKNRSHRYHINRPSSRHGGKYSEYKKCLSEMMLICIKQHLSIIWSSIHENVKQGWGWIEKKRCLLKKSVYSLKDVLLKAMFTLTIFEILLFKGRSVLSPAKRVTGSKSVNKFSCFCFPNYVLFMFGIEIFDVCL